MQDTRDGVEGSQARLLEAGRVLFSTRGYDGVGIREIAARAGANAALVQYHFGGKQGLFNDILLRDLAFAGARLQLAIERAPTAADRLGACIDALVELTRQRPWFAAMLIREQTGGATRLTPGVRARLAEFLQRSWSVLEEGCAAGTFRPINLEAAHLTLVGALTCFALTRTPETGDELLPVSPGERLAPEDFAAHVRDLLERGLRP